MRHFILLIAVATLLSCGQNDTKQKELNLKEKELALRQKELELKEKEIKKDTIVNNIVSTTNSATKNSNPEQLILDIRKEFKRINSAQLTKKKYSFACKNDPANGTVIYYLDNGKVVKIAIDWGFAGDYSTTSEYYYKNDKFIFGYDVAIGGPAEGAETKSEERTYVNNDKTIRYMQNQKIISCTTCEFKESSKEYKILRAYNTNNVTAALCE